MSLTVRYIRLLSYENACKVCQFINRNDTGKMEDDYASITVGGVHTQTNDGSWEEIENFLKSLDVRYEVGETPPHIVTENIVANLKAKGVIK